MPKKKTFEFELTLKRKRGTAKVTVQIDVEDGQAVAIRGLNDKGEDVYDVGFQVRKPSQKKGGDECWKCIKPQYPCPPYELQWVKCPGEW